MATQVDRTPRLVVEPGDRLIKDKGKGRTLVVADPAFTSRGKLRYFRVDETGTQVTGERLPKEYRHERREGVMANPTRDVSKLPRWAQNEIERLTANLEYAIGKLAAGPDNSDTFADPYSENARRPLGQGTMIQFGVERGERFTVHYEAGKLQIHGDEGLAILPSSANGVSLVSRKL